MNFRNFAVAGSLALLLAETTEGAKEMFAGLPASDVVNRTGNYLQVRVYITEDMFWSAMT